MALQKGYKGDIMDINALEVSELKKKFTIKYKTFYGGVAKEGTKQVLDGISFSLKRGEALGIIGKNGCGKSTLLKILTKIMKPDSGKVEIRARVASILELGMGFDPEATGRDNIRMKCTLYGLTNKEIDGCIEDIISFSELGEQIDHPLRTYSSGMTAKLAFSILIHVKCDILIIDEVLSVGDAGFNSKCRMAFEQMKKSGRSILIASHNISTLQEMCDRVMWIENGKVRDIGDPAVICYKYETDLTDSIDTVTQSANSGDIISMNRLGVMYRDGIGVDTDISKAMEYFEKASKLGYPEACVNLANILNGMGKINEARAYYEKASRLGNVEATLAISQLDETNDELEMLKECVIDLANSGNTRAMKLLADMLFYGTIFPKDQKKSIYWYEQCAMANNVQAMYHLGLCFKEGIGTEKNLLNAIEYFERASRFGYVKADLELALIYRRGMGVEKDIDKAIHWYEHAASYGETKSMLELGAIYRDGLGVEINEDRSEAWVKMHYLMGRANIENIIGDIYYQGYSGEKQKQALVWYRAASKHGNAVADLNLASIYNEGLMVEYNPIKRDQYYKKASDWKNAVGLFEFGMHLMNSENESDKTKAEDYIRKAAYMGFRKAIARYCSILLNKNSNSQDLSIMLTLLDETGDLNARMHRKNLKESDTLPN